MAVSQVFSIAVDEVLEDWPERLERERQWVAPQQALALIGEPELLPVIAIFAKREGNAVTQLKTEAKFFAAMKTWWRLLWAGR